MELPFCCTHSDLTQPSLSWVVSSVLSCTADCLAPLNDLPDSLLTLHYLLLALWPKNTSYSGGLPLPTAIQLPPPLSSTVLSLSKVLFSTLADPSRWRHHEILPTRRAQFVYVSLWECTHERRCLWGADEELELQAVWSCLKWVPRAKLRSSAVAVPTLKCWAIFPFL